MRKKERREGRREEGREKERKEERIGMEMVEQLRVLAAPKEDSSLAPQQATHKSP